MDPVELVEPLEEWIEEIEGDVYTLRETVESLAVRVEELNDELCGRARK